MLVFVVPIQSQQVAKSWDKVTKLFENCLKSICNQTSSSFHVVVVCHEKPKIQFEHGKVTYIEVDFPPPSAKDYSAKVIDKARKVLTGLIYAEKLKPTHVMNVDADDYVSKNLAKFVEENPQDNGWFVDEGYVLSENSRFIYLRNQNFYKWCGTCNIVRYNLYNLPSFEDDTKFQHFVRRYAKHSVVVDQMIEQGTGSIPLT